MMIRSLLLIFLSLCMCYYGITQDLLITNTNIISLADSNIYRGYNILIRNGKIEKIFNGQPSSTIAGIKTFDGKEKFVCPGLIDMHVHLFDSTELLTYLSYGITTVINMSGSPEQMCLLHII